MQLQITTEAAASQRATCRTTGLAVAPAPGMSSLVVLLHEEMQDQARLAPPIVASNGEDADFKLTFTGRPARRGATSEQAMSEEEEVARVDGKTIDLAGRTIDRVERGTGPRRPVAWEPLLLAATELAVRPDVCSESQNADARLNAIVQTGTGCLISRVC